MADQLQLRGGTTNEHSTFTGALREVTVDTDKDTLIVHDAATAGGHPLLREDGSNSALSLGTAGTPSIKFTGDTNTGIYSPGADQVAISTGGTGRLFVDASGRVGVNESSPLQALHVAGNIYTANDFMTRNGGGIFLSGSGSYNTGILDSSGALVARTAGAERLLIDSSGRLLIGTSTNLSASANRFLQVSDSNPFVIFHHTGNNPAVDTTLAGLEYGGQAGGSYVAGAFIRAQTDGAWASGDAPTRLVFSTTADGASSPTERMRIDSSGRVGVGTTSPGAPLEVESSQDILIRAESTDRFAHIDLVDNAATTRFTTDGATGTLRLRADNGNAVDSSTIQFEIDGSERVRIDSSGRVGVGTSTAYGILTTASTGINLSSTTVNLGADGANGCIVSDTTSTNNTGVGYWFRHGGLKAGIASSRVNTGNWGTDLRFYTHPTTTSDVNNVYERMRIDPAGNVGVGTTSPSNLLDIEGDTPRLEITDTAGTGNAARPGVIMRDSGATNLFFIGNGAIADSDLTVRNYTSAGATSLWTNNTERMRIDSSGRVGIGTSSPNFSSFGSSSGGVHIKEVGANNSGIKLEQGTNILHLMSSGSKNYIFGSTNHPLGISTNGTERLSITAAGNVGIGTTSPNGTLSVAESGNGAKVTLQNTSSVRLNYIGLGADDDVIDIAADENNQGSNSAITLRVDGSERARIDSSGRLLVGTSSSRSVDNEKILQIEGVNQQSSSMSLTRNTNSSAPPNISFGKSRGSTLGSNTIVQSGDSLGVIVFCGADGSDTNSIAAAITGQVDGTPGSNDMPGRLVFSTTADGASSPTERMRISNGGQIAGYSATGWDGFSSSMQDAAGTTRRAFLGRYGATATNTGTVSFAVYTNGNVQNTNNSYGALSDIKLKENIVNASSQWDDLKAIQVRNYNFKEGQTHTQIGVVAQEVETVSPGLVTESPDIDEDGNDLGTVTKSVNYSVLYMKAVKALQEAMERIETLEAKVSALEGN